MNWETIKKEMTITRILIVVVAILLCCFLTFGLTEKPEKDPANNEKGLQMLNKLFHEYLEGNVTHTGPPEGDHDPIPTTPSPRPRKFHSVGPPVDTSKSESVTTEQYASDIGKNAALDHPRNASKNETETLDLVVVVDIEKEPQPVHDDSKLIDVQNTNLNKVDEVKNNHFILSKTVRVSKVEEVFEDIVAQNVRRVIKEDRVERVEVASNKNMALIANEFDTKDLLSI